MNKVLKKINWRSLSVPLIAVLAGFVIGAIVMLAFGYNPIWGYEDIFTGVFGTPRGIGEMIQTTGPLMLEALAFAIAMKAGLFNIGMSGQALAGWFSSIWFALSFPSLPKLVLIPLMITVGMLAGALVGAIPGILKAFLGTSEVIVTIMMNYVIVYFTTFLLYDVMSKSIISPQGKDQTIAIGSNASFRAGWLSSLTNNSSLNIGIFIALITLVIMAIVFSKTTLGYEIKAVGLNPDASEYAGISAKRTIILSMIIAGALAGLGGLVYGANYQGVGNFVSQSASLDIGFNGMAVALLGENNPVGIFFAAILFSILQTGGPYMSQDSIPPQMSSIVMATIIFFIAIRYVIQNLMPKAKKVAEVAK